MVDVENKNTIETGDTTSDELLQLKKELADEVVSKMIEQDPKLPSLAKWAMAEFLVDNDTLKDKVRDVVIWLLWDSLWFITPTLEKYREMFWQVKTKMDLEALKTTIFNEMSWVAQAVSGSSESNEESWESNEGGDGDETSDQNQQSSDSKTDSDNTEGQSDNDKKGSSDTKSENSNDSNKSENKESSKSSDSSVWSNEKAKESSGEIHELDKFDINVSAEAKKLWDGLKWKEKPAVEPFACAKKVYDIEKSKWHIKNTKYLTVVDFTKNQIKDNRLFVINLDTNTVEYAEKCGHGQGSGGKEWADSFWNKSWSNKSSLWALVTADGSKWNGKHTRMWNKPKWLEDCNDKSADRGIFIHPVKSEVYASWKPTSQWCFTIEGSQSYVNGILDKIQWWSLLFSYAKSKDYFEQSDYFKVNSDGSVAA